MLRVALAIGLTVVGGSGPVVHGGPAVRAMLHGIPQTGTTLGRVKAPVTLVEFADVQCPFCAQWARKALPPLVRDYVRPGKVRIVFTGMHFVGPDSVTGLRTALAASAQNRFWHVLDLLFANQGAENAGWVTDRLLRAIGREVDGLDTAKMLRDRSSKSVDALLAGGHELAMRAGIRSTPTFAVGRTGGTLKIVEVSSLTAAALRPALNAALRG